MRPLIRRKQPDTGPRDPAPSRLGFRMQRLMLTPGFRATVRIGVPLMLIAVIAGSWYAKPANRAALSQMIVDTRESFEQRPQFMVRGARIEGADASVSAAVEAFLPSQFPVSSFDLDLDGIRTEIEVLDPVKSASLRVGQSGLLEIKITPRRPVAVWRDDNMLRLVDGDGIVAGRIEARSNRRDLPLIAGDGAAAQIGEAMALFATAAPLSGRVRGLVRMGERRWDMVLDRDQRILLPSEGPVAALDRVLALDAARDLLARDIAVVDMRNAHRPTIRLNQDAVAALRGVVADNDNNNEVGN